MFRPFSWLGACSEADLLAAGAKCVAEIEELLGDRMPEDIMEELRETFEELSRRERDASLQTSES